MNLQQVLSLSSSSNLPHAGKPVGFVGKKYRVIDYPGYGDEISEHDDKDEAEHAAEARPYSKVIEKKVAATAAPTEKSSLFPRDDSNDTPSVRDKIRQRRVKVNPDVD